MGSFASTCCVSGLPIEAGDQVRWFLLTENPYYEKGRFVCYTHGLWIPRTWPIKAEYNDYGSIENWETGPVQEAVLKGLQLDLVEVGVGDNSCHDVAAWKEMSFKEMLEAVWEGRVRVNQRSRPSEEKSLPDYIPMLKSVEAVLSSIKLPENGRYLVDEDGVHVRVRWDGLSADYGKDEHWLRVAAEKLQLTFATVITAGHGSYANDIELRVFTAPGKSEDGYPRQVRFVNPTPSLLVQQAMIREDVWQALVQTKLTSDWGKTISLESCRAEVDEYMKAREEVETLFKEEKATNQSEKRAVAQLRQYHLEALYGIQPGSALLAKDVAPSTKGLSAHAAIILGSGPVPDGFLDLAAEFAYIEQILGSVRHVWRPSYTAGPQFGSWEMHEKVLAALRDIASARDKEIKARQAE